MRRRLQIAGSLRLGAQLLNRIEHVLLLGQKRVAELLGPVQLIVHHLKRLRHCRQGFDAGIPGLGLHRVLKRLSLDRWVLPRPSSRLDHLQRIGRSHQDLREQQIRIERDRRDELRDLRLRERRLVLGLGLHWSRNSRVLRAGGRSCEVRNEHERRGAQRETAHCHCNLV